MTDNADFGDSEPEDAWDSGDSLVELIDNLCLRLALLGYPCRLPRSASLLERLSEMVEAQQRAKLRAELIMSDIGFIRGRLHVEGG